MNISFDAKRLAIDDQPFEMELPILDAFELGDRVIVLLDPDSYLLNPEYKAKRRQGAEAFRNLIAITKDGKKIWEAEFPTNSDYYYRILSKKPLKADSFSSYECEIDPNTGKIASKSFSK